MTYLYAKTYGLIMDALNGLLIIEAEAQKIFSILEPHHRYMDTNYPSVGTNIAPAKPNFVVYNSFLGTV